MVLVIFISSIIFYDSYVNLSQKQYNDVINLSYKFAQENDMEVVPIDLIFIESGGDNLSATFSPELADITIYVIDVSEGEKIPRKGGPGITKSSFFVINKTDLAPYVGASLEVMERDTKKMRPTLPWTFTNLKKNEGVDEVIAFIEKYLQL